MLGRECGRREGGPISVFNLYSIPKSLFSTQHIVHTTMDVLHTTCCKGSEQKTEFMWARSVSYYKVINY